MSDAAAGSFVRAISAADVPSGEGRTVDVGGRPLAIFNVGGVFHAIDDTCPHQEGPLGEGFLSGCVVACPWHFWEFDVTTGCNLDDPEMKVRTYETRVEDGYVLVRID